jgi:hypothetical protein
LKFLRKARDNKWKAKFDSELYHFFLSGIMSLVYCSWKWGHPCPLNTFFSDYYCFLDTICLKDHVCYLVGLSLKTSFTYCPLPCVEISNDLLRWTYVTRVETKRRIYVWVLVKLNTAMSSRGGIQSLVDMMKVASHDSYCIYIIQAIFFVNYHEFVQFLCRSIIVNNVFTQFLNVN